MAVVYRRYQRNPLATALDPVTPTLFFSQADAPQDTAVINKSSESLQQ